MLKEENMSKKACLDEDQIKRHSELLSKFDDTKETKEYLVEWNKYIEKLKEPTSVQSLRAYLAFKKFR